RALYLPYSIGLCLKRRSTCFLLLVLRFQALKLTVDFLEDFLSGSFLIFETFNGKASPLIALGVLFDLLSQTVCPVVKVLETLIFYLLVAFVLTDLGYELVNCFLP